jgi:1-acyl-sn-glycerol-3-phosphate acyltransferase
MRLQTAEFPLSNEATTTPYAGPHRWQISAGARLIRRALRHRTYTRWVNAYCDPFVVTGLERIAALRGPTIFVANHQSHMDTLVLAEALPARIRDNLYFGAAADRWFVRGRKKLELNPLYQSFVLGNFPVVRGGGAKSLDYARWLLQHRCNVCLFPEGTRATDDELGPFKQGPALLALDLDVPVVPVYLSGLRRIRPKGALHARRGAAGVHVLEPVRFVAGTPVLEATAELRAVLSRRHMIERAHLRATSGDALHDAA